MGMLVGDDEISLQIIVLLLDVCFFSFLTDSTCNRSLYMYPVISPLHFTIIIIAIIITFFIIRAFRGKWSGEWIDKLLFFNLGCLFQLSFLAWHLA